MEGRLQQAQKLGLGGSGSGDAGWGGRSWEALGVTDLSCVKEERGTQKMRVRHEQAWSMTDWVLVGLR